MNNSARNSLSMFFFKDFSFKIMLISWRIKLNLKVSVKENLRIMALVPKHIKNLSPYIAGKPISEVKKHGDLYHRVCLSHSFVYNAFYHRGQSRVETKEWGFKKYFDFDPIDYSYIYLFFLLSHELQHAQQCDYLRLKNYQDRNCHLQYEKHNWKKYANVARNDNVLEFDAEVASIEKTIKLYESYF